MTRKPFEDDDYIVKNIGKGKNFPAGQECTYRGKKIPYVCAWSPKGSITSEISKLVHKTLNAPEVFNRSTNINPML